jgi:uncharacterized protein (UPF0332 family)
VSFSKHAAVIAAFGREFAKTGELPVELHRFLIDASEDRTEADYVATSEITENEVDARITRASWRSSSRRPARWSTFAGSSQGLRAPG